MIWCDASTSVSEAQPACALHRTSRPDPMWWCHRLMCCLYHASAVVTGTHVAPNTLSLPTCKMATGVQFANLFKYWRWECHSRWLGYVRCSISPVTLNQLSLKCLMLAYTEAMKPFYIITHDFQLVVVLVSQWWHLVLSPACSTKVSWLASDP